MVMRSKNAEKKVISRKGFKRRDLTESKFFRGLIILAIVLIYIWAVFETLSVEMSCGLMIENYKVVKSKTDVAKGTWYDGAEGRGIIVNGITVPVGAATTVINIPRKAGNYLIMEDDGTATIAKEVTRRDGLDLMVKSFILSLTTLIVSIVTLTKVYSRSKWQKVGHWVLCIYEVIYVWFMLLVYGNAFICFFGVNADKLWMVGVLLTLALVLSAIYGRFVKESDGRLQPQRKH